MARGMGSPNFDKAKQKQIASLGGKAAHARGLAHVWTSETARQAGLKGVQARQAKKAQAA